MEDPLVYIPHQLQRSEQVGIYGANPNAHPESPSMPELGPSPPAEQPGAFRQDLPPPYRCNLCEKTFTVPARLLRHHRIHTGEKPYKCDYCEKTFSVKENLNVHRRIHTKERPYKCTLCNRAFEHSGKLHRHMRTHTGERPHKCEICSKTFVQSGQLVIHMRAHTGEKPYTCDYCQKGFTCSKQLKVHIRTHTGEKPYECDICGKTFGYNHVLKMHKMSHLGEKLYKCTLCDRFFGSRKSLDRHIKEHNKEQSPSTQNSGPSVPPPLICENDQPQILSNCEQSQLPVLDNTMHQSSLHSYDQEPAPSFDHESSSFQMANKTDGSSKSPFTPLTPPRSPDENVFKGNPKQLAGYDDQTPSREKAPVICPEYFQSLRQAYSQLGKEPPSEYQLPQLVFFTTVTGERLACPADLLLRLQASPADKGYDSEKEMLQKELKEILQKEEERKQREVAFCESVLKVLESCIGYERLRRLGYPKITIDEVIMNTLKFLGTQPCWEPSLSEMDRIKVNLRLLLECCVPDEEMWLKFGWKGKAIEDIIHEFFKKY